MAAEKKIAELEEALKKETEAHKSAASSASASSLLSLELSDYQVAVGV